MSTLSLPNVEFHPEVRYLETTFPTIYPYEDLATRTKEVFRVEPENSLFTDSVGPDSLSMPLEDVLNFQSYYGTEDEPSGQTHAEKVAWNEDSSRMRRMLGRASVEYCMRVENDTQTRWMNQKSTVTMAYTELVWPTGGSESTSAPTGGSKPIEAPAEGNSWFPAQQEESVTAETERPPERQNRRIGAHGVLELVGERSRPAESRRECPSGH